LGSLSPREEKLIKILDFAEIEIFVSSVQIANPPKDYNASHKSHQNVTLIKT